RIRVGADADLTVFAPEESFVVDVSRLHHKNQVSAYAGRTLQGVVRRTFLAGREIDDEPRGRLLTRGSR
ncbi:MAG TPA: allantoinase, partial [Nocardioides sp.]|nr:allantoinase [Nocardioides sp.]